MQVWKTFRKQTSTPLQVSEHVTHLNANASSMGAMEEQGDGARLFTNHFTDFRE
jgi:hypothetical protein